MIEPITDFRKEKILSDMRGYLFKNKVVKITDISGKSNQGRIVSIDQDYGITTFVGTRGKKQTFKFESIRNYGVV